MKRRSMILGALAALFAPISSMAQEKALLTGSDVKRISEKMRNQQTTVMVMDNHQPFVTIGIDGWVHVVPTNRPVRVYQAVADAMVKSDLRVFYITE